MIQEILQNKYKNQTVSTPFMQFSPLENSKERHFIGIGHFGTHALDIFLERQSGAMHTIIHLPYCEKINYVPNDYYQENLNDGEHENTLVENYSIDIDLEDVLGEFNDYVFIGGIGEKNTNVIMQSCIDYLQSKGKNYSVIAIEPFTFQGMIAKRNAFDFCSKNKSNNNVLYFQLESIKSKYKEMKFHEALQKVYEDIYAFWKRYIQTMELIAQMRRIA